MKQELINYIDYCLAQARLVPTLETVWVNQAFGALNLFCRVIYKTDPQAETEMINYWNEVIHPQFVEIEMERGKK